MNWSLMSSLKFVVVLTLLFTWACEPAELPDPVDPDPVFFSEIQLNGEKSYWGSGKNGYYNFSSFERVRDNAIRFSSILQRDTCTYPCPSSFRVDIYSLDAIPTGGVDPVIQFRPGSRRWENALENDVRFLMNADLSLTSGSTGDLKSRWMLNGATIANDVTSISEEIVDTVGGFELCTDLTNSWGAYQRICNKIVDPVFRPMVVFLEASRDTGSNAKFAARVQFGKPPYTYYWNGNKGTALNVVKIPRDSSEMNLMVMDNAGNTVRIKNGVYPAEPGLLAVNGQVKILLERKQELAPLFGKVALRYIDKDGVEYSSARGPQDPDAYFKVDEIQLFMTAPGERPLAKVKLQFGCSMYDVTGKNVRVDNGQATMVFKFPE